MLFQEKGKGRNLALGSSSFAKAKSFCTCPKSHSLRTFILKAAVRGFENICMGVKKQTDSKGGQRKPEEDGHTHCSWTPKS